jgi:hypothetical protein
MKSREFTAEGAESAEVLYVRGVFSAISAYSAVKWLFRVRRDPGVENRW